MSKENVVREASLEEFHQRDRVTYEAWGKCLTLDQYLEHNQVLREHPYAKKNMRSWVYGKKDLIYASCETYCMKSSIAENASEGLTQCLASFYVEPGFRGKGHAAELVTQLSSILRLEHVQASIIFSEVDERLYWQGGFQSMKGYLWSFSRADFHDEFLDEEKKLPHPDVEWIDQDHLSTIVGKSGLATPGAFSFLVYQDQVDWHLTKARFYANALRRPAIERIGATKDQAWVLWFHDFVTQQLLVLWLEASEKLEAKHLIAAALDEASRYNFQRVLVWPNPALNHLLDFGRRAPFKDIPMILPISPELRAKDWTAVTAVHRFS